MASPLVIAQVEELYAVRCTVGSDVLTADDFVAVSGAQLRLARVLLERGPWFVDEPPAAAAPKKKRAA